MITSSSSDLLQQVLATTAFCGDRSVNRFFVAIGASERNVQIELKVVVQLLNAK